MFLQRVEAVRYGELSEVVLGPFGGGLNIVVGRNEAGKSSFTSLVRHVLFGFPRGRTTERLYQPTSGDLSGLAAWSFRKTGPTGWSNEQRVSMAVMRWSTDHEARSLWKHFSNR